MTGLPLPEPVAWRYASTRGVDLVRNRWDELLRSMGPADMTEDALVTVDQLHAYAAAKTAEIEAECARLREALGIVLEGWTLPFDARKILETAYYNTQRYAALRGKESK